MRLVTMMMIGCCLVGGQFKQLHANEVESARNVELVMRLIGGDLCEKNIDSYDEILADDVVLHGPNTQQETQGIAKLQELDRELAKSFSNIRIHIDEIFAKHDKVVVFWTAYGEQNHVSMTVTGHGIYQIKEGKICAIWQTWDKMESVQ